MIEFRRPNRIGRGWRLAIGFGMAVLALGLFGLFAIPQVGPRPPSTYSLIVNNLRVIDNQKQLWAAEQKKGDHDTPSETDLAPYFSNGRFPASIIGETYIINNVRTQPTATIPSRLTTPKMTIEAGGTVALPDK
jgi:hypothetical protein